MTMSSNITCAQTVVSCSRQQISVPLSACQRPSLKHVQPVRPQAPLLSLLQRASLGSRNVISSSLRSQQSQAPVPTSPAALQQIPHALAEYKQLLLFLALSGAAISVTDVAGAADSQLITELSLAKIETSQVIDFFVNNPFVTLGTAVAAYFILPRLIRATVKFVVVPVAIGGVAYLIVTNPSTSFSVAKTSVGYVVANPAITSIAILIALALVLSPYVLVLGGIFLVFSAVSLPGPLKRILPAPVVEAERQLDVVRQQVKGPVNSIKDSLFGKKSKDGMGVGRRNTILSRLSNIAGQLFAHAVQALAPAHLDASRLLPAPQLEAESDK